MALIKIRINKWEEYNPRKDIKATHWLRLSNRLLEDPDFYHFTHSELMFWIYVLSIASQKFNSEISINHDHAERVGRFDHKTIDNALKKLESIGAISHVLESTRTRTLRARNVHVTRTSRARNADVTLQTDRQTNKQTDRSSSVRSGKPDRPKPPSPPPLHELDPRFAELKPKDDSLLHQCKPELQRQWLELWDPGWIEKQAKHAKSWLLANPQKPRKNIGAFLNRWLNKASSELPSKVPKPPGTDPPTNEPQFDFSEVQVSEEDRRLASELYST